MIDDRHRDRGSASVWVLAIGLCVVLFAGALTTVGSAIVARQRAQIAADLGALAGAQQSARGTATACARAARLVSANGAALGGCLVDGLDVVVTAVVRVAGLGWARAVARAGPIRTPDALFKTGTLVSVP